MLGNNLLESIFSRFDNYTFYQVDTSIVSLSSPSHSDNDLCSHYDIGMETRTYVVQHHLSGRYSIGTAEPLFFV